MTRAAQARLVLVGPPEPGREIPIAAPVVTVGRAGEADIVIEDKTISRLHARLRLEGVSLSVEDLGSRNGIRIGGAQVPRGTVGVGQEFLIGKVRLRLVIPGVAAAPASPAGADDPGRTPPDGVPVPAAPVPAAPVPAVPVPTARAAAPAERRPAPGSSPQLPAVRPAAPAAVAAEREVGVSDVARRVEAARPRGPFDWTTLVLVVVAAVLVGAVVMAYRTQDDGIQVVPLILQPGEPRRISLPSPGTRLDGPTDSYVLAATLDPANARVLRLEALDHGESTAVVHLADGRVVRYEILVRGDAARPPVEPGSPEASRRAQGYLEQARTAYDLQRLAEARRCLREASACRPGGMLAVEISELNGQVEGEIQRLIREHVATERLYVQQGDLRSALAENEKIRPYLEPETQEYLDWEERRRRLEAMAREREGPGR